MTTQRVRVERHGPVALLTLDRAERRNAVDAAMTAALDAALADVEADASLRVAVLAAEGPVFCAGSDLVEGPGDPTPDGGPYGVIRRARSNPLIAAVEGPALGGGFEIVLACDLVVASPAAAFGLPEATRGRIALAGGLFRAADRLPRTIALELLLTGGRLDAARAHTLGLVNRLTEPGGAVGAALVLAREICGSAPVSVEQTLAALRAVEAEDEATGWAATAAAVEVVSASPDRAEGTAAFAEKRLPRWAED